MKAMSRRDFLYYIIDVLEREGLSEFQLRRGKDGAQAVIQVEWVSGGVTGGSYNGGAQYAMVPEEAKTLEGVGAVLRAIAPDAGFQAYLDIMALARTDSREERGYYSNSTTYTRSFISLDDLYDALGDLGIVEPSLKDEASIAFGEGLSDDDFKEAMQLALTAPATGSLARDYAATVFVDRPSTPEEATLYGVKHLSGYLTPSQSFADYSPLRIIGSELAQSIFRSNDSPSWERVSIGLSFGEKEIQHGMTVVPRQGGDESASDAPDYVPLELLRLTAIIKGWIAPPEFSWKMDLEQPRPCP